jgi:ribosomal protein L11 methyltransferase
MRYVELRFTVPAAAVEGYVEALCAAGAAGVEERDQSTLARPEVGKGELVAWLAPDEVDAFLARAHAEAAGLPEARVARRDRDDDEWRDAWKRYFSTRKIGRYVIVPSWERYLGQGDELLLHLDPGRAFGTGGHASTRLCLEALSRPLLPVERFCDLGCGSGVLTIACALRFPEARGLGVDLDPEAAEVSRENAARNGVGARLHFRVGTIDDVDGEYQLVTANIQPEVLVPIAGRVAARLAPGGVLVLSGILVEAAAQVEEAYRAAGLALTAAPAEDGWRALVLSRRAA